MCETSLDFASLGFSGWMRDGQNPSRATLKPRLKPLFVGVKGESETRVSQVQDFVHLHYVPMGKVSLLHLGP